jgi:hypothetical protein
MSGQCGVLTVLRKSINSRYLFISNSTKKNSEDHWRFFPFQGNIVKSWQGIEFEEKYAFTGG